MTTLPPDILARLCLTETTPGRVAEIPSPDPQRVTRGYVPAEVTPSPLPVSVPITEARGVDLAWVGSTEVRLRWHSDASFRVGRGGVSFDPDSHPRTASLLLTDDPVCALVFPDADALAFSVEGGRPMVREYFGHVVDIRIPGDVASPIREWLATCSDARLASLLEQRLELSAGLFDHVVAVGLLARLAPPPTATVAREALQRLLRGEHDPALWRERGWFLALGADEQAWVEACAAASCRGILEELERLLDDPRPGDQEWDDDLLAACRRRDDIEGVRTLLRAAGPCVALDTALEWLDAAGSDFVLAVSLPVLQDGHLSMARAAAGPAWWTEAVAEPADAPTA